MRLLLTLFVSIVLLTSCSDIKMEQDILAYHIYSQTNLDLDSKNKEYVALLAMSFGMSESEVIEIQQHIHSQKTEGALRDYFKKAIKAKLGTLQNKTGKSAQKDFIVNVLGPYLSFLSRDEQESVWIEHLKFQDEICALFATLFSDNQNTLGKFFEKVRRSQKFGDDLAESLKNLNATMEHYGYFVSFMPNNSANILAIKDEILPKTPYANSSIRILNLKRIMPGLLPPMDGYIKPEINTVIIVDDLIDATAKELMAELQADDFKKYTNRRFSQYWQASKLKLNVPMASRIYIEHLQRDFAGKDFDYIKKAVQIGVVIRETKHMIDNIEHPELSLNIDQEFSGLVTEAIYSPTPYSALFFAINRMQEHSISNRVPALHRVTKELWTIAMRTSRDPSYTLENMRIDLWKLYANYKTVREGAQFESLKNFEKIVGKVNEFYNK